ncbi:MAG: KEOPS complex subunit Cgi121 [Nitrososphaerales archaeon]
MTVPPGVHYQELHWFIQRDSENKLFGFAQAFRFRTNQNLSSLARGLEDGVAVCTPKYIAGTEHVRRVLIQAIEYWGRAEGLARNRSIDLVMRITCQSQISRAVKLSEVTDTRQIALFGLVASAEDASRCSSTLLSLGGNRDDSLLKMDSKRELFLKRFHNLPQWCTSTQIIDLLAEKSILLAFSK